MTADLQAVVAAIVNGPLAPKSTLDAPIGKLTTYRVGGNATALVTLQDRADLDVLAEVLVGREVPVIVIGRGSNLLVSDTGFVGIALVLGSAFAGVDIDADQGIVTCGAAAKLPVVARTSVQAGLAGFEWAVGVPGSVGGAVRMNAGGHGAEMKDSIIDVEVFDVRGGGLRTRDRAGLQFGYRTSALTATDLVIGARLQLSAGDPSSGAAEMAAIVQWRRDHQPGGQNAGSVFTNPDDDSAGRLIDAAGLKGFRIGTAEVSPRHANFIQADADGRADDVRALMREIQSRVFAATGVRLEAETHLVGFADGD